MLALGAVIVRDGQVPDWEERVFRAVNDLPEVLYPLLWPFQQLGALVVGPIVALVALVLRRYWLALAAVIVTVAKLVSERAVKALVSRQRPFTSIGPDIEVRGDVSLVGESFVSGHAILVAALGRCRDAVPPTALATSPVGTGRAWSWWAASYVGAHNPLDVICGAALGSRHRRRHQHAARCAAWCTDASPVGVAVTASTDFVLR